MQCNHPIVIAITQSRWQSCSSATFVKVGVLQPTQYYFNVIICLSIYELGARHHTAWEARGPSRRES
eukprot:6746317-Prymnesium_polylepis.1